ncbi:glycosyltransferase family 4 protein [Trichlorobacter lovleyi]|uniref:glycosyltransferase family 4 protein n=1 Tax=Trichlorobacter lovleyi TaxID=313985 RepID=UPI003D0DACA4
MNILFVAYSQLNCNSGIHIFSLANNLVELGHTCAVCVPDQPEATGDIGTPRFATLLLDQIKDRPLMFPDGRGADVIHAWTPRELVRRTTENLLKLYSCPYFVHLEDNEQHLTELHTRISIAQMARLSYEELDARIPLHLSHPLRSQDFLAGAAGVTVLIDKLLTNVPQEVPGCVIWPSFDESLNWAIPCDNKLRREIGIASTDYVITYTGNVHSANRSEVLSLYIAVALLNRSGVTTKLVRTGSDYIPLCDAVGMAEFETFLIALGFIPRKDMPKVLSIADVLVQPGRSDNFNDYRFPSKLPEYFASGKPVLIPATNIGRYVKDSVDCILLKRGDACEIATQLMSLLPDVERRRQLGTNALEFARLYFSWQKSSKILADFYTTKRNDT